MTQRWGEVLQQLPIAKSKERALMVTRDNVRSLENHHVEFVSSCNFFPVGRAVWIDVWIARFGRLRLCRGLAARFAWA